jgi:ribosome-binding ATPase YchF (GTP1/OBG family)
MMTVSSKSEDDKRMRRRFAVNLLASTLLLCPLFTAGSQSQALEQVVESNFEGEFAAAMSRVAALREANQSIGISVTDLFKEITDRHSLVDFRNFLVSRYQFQRVWTVVGNSEYTDIKGPALTRFDSRFPSNNTVRIGFYYDSEWKNIVSLDARCGSVRRTDDDGFIQERR